LLDGTYQYVAVDMRDENEQYYICKWCYKWDRMNNIGITWVKYVVNVA